MATTDPNPNPNPNHTPNPNSNPNPNQVCDSDGHVAMLDLRAASSARFRLHDKKIYSVDHSPTR